MDTPDLIPFFAAAGRIAVAPSPWLWLWRITHGAAVAAWIAFAAVVDRCIDALCDVSIGDVDFEDLEPVVLPGIGDGRWSVSRSSSAAAPAPHDPRCGEMDAAVQSIPRPATPLALSTTDIGVSS